MTTTLKLIPVEDAKPGMVDSCGNVIQAVRHTAKRVYLTVPSVLGGTWDEPKAKGSKMAIKA